MSQVNKLSFESLFKNLSNMAAPVFSSLRLPSSCLPTNHTLTAQPLFHFLGVSRSYATVVVNNRVVYLSTITKLRNAIGCSANSQHGGRPMARCDDPASRPRDVIGLYVSLIFAAQEATVANANDNISN